MSDNRPPIEPLTIYLARSTYEQPEQLLKTPGDLQAQDITLPSGQLLGRLYVRPCDPKSPKWARFFDGVVDKKLFGTVASSSAVLIVPVEGHLAALTFGSGRHLLAPDSWEERFGLRVALNSIEEDRLRGIDKATFDPVALHSKEQASRAASTRDFGINIETDLLRGVIGTPRDGALGKRMCGMDALHVTVSTTVYDLRDILARYITQYHATTYTNAFAWVDQIAEVSQPGLRDELDARVIEAIRSASAEVWMAAPEVIPWEHVGGFRFGWRKSDLELYDIDLEAFLAAAGGSGSVSPDLLRKKHVYCLDTDGQQLEDWPAYRCLCAQLDVAGECYVLSTGKWFRVARGFVTEVNDFFAHVPDCSWSLPEYDDDTEGHYNKRVAAAIPTVALLDQNKIPYGGGHSSVEFCDLFTRDRDMVHVKRRGSSKTLSHLFAQALVAGELFQLDADFRQRVANILPPSHRPDNPSARPAAGEYGIVLAIIAEADGPLTLPFFSRVSLRHAVRRLSGFGYSVKKLKVSVAVRRRKLKRFRR